MGEPILWRGMDLFTHMLIIGPTRCGKTSNLIKPMIYQLMKLKAMGVPLGISVIEPKGDVAQLVADLANEMNLDYTHIDPTKSAGETDKFNPMEGDIDDVAEATVVVLKGLFGKQDPFFATVQELSSRNVTKLLKELYGDSVDIMDVLEVLRDPALLERKVKELKAKKGNSNLTDFFEQELLGTMAEKYRTYVIGLRAQLENITSNSNLRHIMTGKSNLNIDNHFETGGILAVNTALGLLRSSGDAFGQFVIMHLQNGTFRRSGSEETRVPHFLFIDEYSRYINPDVEIFLSLAAEYRVAGIFATQSLGQLEVESGKIGAKAMKRAIMASCRNKIAFGGLTMEDAKEFAEEFGKDKIIVRQSTYKNNVLLPNLFPDSYRDTEDEEFRFSPTDLKDGIPKFHYIHQLLADGTPQKPAIATGNFIPRNWKEMREWEKKEVVPKGFFEKLRNIKKKRDEKKRLAAANLIVRNGTTFEKPNPLVIAEEEKIQREFLLKAANKKISAEIEQVKEDNPPIEEVIMNCPLLTVNTQHPDSEVLTKITKDFTYLTTTVKENETSPTLEQKNIDKKGGYGELLEEKRCNTNKQEQEKIAIIPDDLEVTKTSATADVSNRVVPEAEPSKRRKPIKTTAGSDFW